jgi:hypothetical protein
VGLFNDRGANISCCLKARLSHDEEALPKEVTQVLRGFEQDNSGPCIMTALYFTLKTGLRLDSKNKRRNFNWIKGAQQSDYSPP